MCGDSPVSVQVQLRNSGYNDQDNNFNVHIQVNGSAVASTSQAFTGILAGKDTIISYSVSPVLDTRKGGIYSIKAYTDLVIDKNAGNDTAHSTVHVFALPDAKFIDTVFQTTTVTYLGYFTALDSTLSGYTWDFGDGSKPGSGAKVSHLFNSSGHFIIQLTAKNSNGCTSSSSDSIKLIITGLSKIENATSNLNIYPNPFKEQATISYTVSNSSSVKIEMLNMQGETISTLINTKQEAGEYHLPFNAANYRAGIYFIRMTIGENVITKQITLVK